MSEQWSAAHLHLKHALRDVIWQLTNRHRQGNAPNIAIFASRRSGSTLLMEALAACRGVKFVDQPFALFVASADQMRRLPICDGGQLQTLDPSEQELVSNFVNAIVAGRLHVNESWRFWRRNHPWLSERIVFKITDAHAAADWLADTFGWRVLVLTRHPLAQVVSVERHGWPSRALAFLRDPTYHQNYLDADQSGRAWQVWRQGDTLDRLVLGWALENLPLVRLLPKRPHWHYLSFEGLLLHREDVARNLATKLSLDNQHVIQRVLAAPSKTTDLVAARRRVSTIEGYQRTRAIRAGRQASFLHDWRHQIDDRRERRAFDLLAFLGIDLYRPEDDLPAMLWRWADASETAGTAHPHRSE